MTPSEQLTDLSYSLLYSGETRSAHTMADVTDALIRESYEVSVSISPTTPLWLQIADYIAYQDIRNGTSFRSAKSQSS